MSYEFNFGAVLQHWPMLARGAWVTLVLTFWATVAGFVVGTLCAVVRTSGPKWGVVATVTRWPGRRLIGRPECLMGQ